MNLKTLIGFKKKEVPASNETVLVDAVQLWEVRWRSRYDGWSGSVRPEVEVFVSEESARAFAASLKQAFKLVRNTADDDVSVTKAKS